MTSSALLTLALLFGQAADVPPDPLAEGAKGAKAGAADDLLKEGGAKPAGPIDGGGIPGQPKEFNPAAPGAEGAAPPAEGAATPAAPAESSENAAPPAKSRTFAEWWKDLKSAGALGLMIDGGFFMWPILAMGVLATGVFIERWRTLKMVNVDTRGFREQVRELLQADRAEEALELCSREKGPSAAILTAGLRKYVVLRRLNYDPAKIEEQVIKAMDDYSVHVVAALEKHLPILATVSSVAPMIGSVGTVWGMIILFQDIVNQFGTVNIILAAAAGIKLKLLVTVWGLIVGIPAYVAHIYFTTVIGRYVLNVEEAATELVEAVTLRMATATSRPGSGSPLSTNGGGIRHEPATARV
jgi:biopolymer transport protein ExbB